MDSRLRLPVRVRKRESNKSVSIGIQRSYPYLLSGYDNCNDFIVFLYKRYNYKSRFINIP